MSTKSRSPQNTEKDRTRNDKGAMLEQIVALLHKGRDVKVETNVKRTPISGDESRKREIDILLSSVVAGYPIEIAIQCKNYKKKVEVGTIGEFKDLLDDVGIPYRHGIIVSVEGYRKGAIDRAKELGIQTLVLHGLDRLRLNAEIHKALQFFVHLLLVVEQFDIETEFPNGQLAHTFYDENKNFCGFVTDLIVNAWRLGEIPNRLGQYNLTYRIPRGWYNFADGKIIAPHKINSKVRVVAYLAEMPGKVNEFTLKTAHTHETEKFRLEAEFDTVNNLIVSTHEFPILSESKLESLKKDDVKLSIENRIRLPKIFINNHLEPLSKKAFQKFISDIEGLTIDEISRLPIPNFGEVEGDIFQAMQEKSAFGEPLFLDDGLGNLLDVRLLTKNEDFDQILKLEPFFHAHPSEAFANYLANAFLRKGKVLLSKACEAKNEENRALIGLQAERLFGEAKNYSKNNLEIHLQIGIAFGEASIFEKSLEYFDYVIQKQPLNPQARFNRFETLLRMGKADEVLNEIENAYKSIQDLPLKFLLQASKAYAIKRDFINAADAIVSVYLTNSDEIVESEHWHELVENIYENHRVTGLGLVMSEIYSYYARKFAKTGKKLKSKGYLRSAIITLTEIRKVTPKECNPDFKSSFNNLVNRTQTYLEEINHFYSTLTWQKKLKFLK